MQRLFFATANDLVPVLERVEAKHRIGYTLCGLFPSAELRSVLSGASIPTLREPAPRPDAIACPQYLITAHDRQVAIREVPQNKGGLLYAVDQLANPESVVFQPGGIYGSDVLLHGRVGSASTSPFSVQLHRAFASAIGKLFEHVKAFYVGPEAHQLWQRGYRLTAAVQSPREYDLAA